MKFKFKYNYLYVKRNITFMRVYISYKSIMISKKKMGLI